MAQQKAYVAMRFVDKDGTHEVGEEITFDMQSSEDQDNFDRLVEYGIVSTSPPAKTAKAER